MSRRVFTILLAVAIVFAGSQWLAVDAHANGWHFGMYASSEEKVSLGFGYGMAIRDDGSLWAWGSGILGDGVARDFWDNEYAAVPVKIMDSVASVVALRERTFAITTDGTLYAWGAGILGDGVMRDFGNPALTPVRIMDSVVSVTAYETSAVVGVYSAFAIRTDGSLWAWGSGQLGDGVLRYLFSENPALSPVKVMDSVASVYTDYDRAYAVKQDGTLWAWGSTNAGLLGCGLVGAWDDNRATPIQIMDSVASVWIGSASTLVVKTDGSLWTWGWGQIGDGVERDYDSPLSTPIKIMDDVASVSGNRALKTDGSLWAWGGNWSGRVGDGTTDARLSPVKVLDSVAVLIDSVVNYTMVIRTDGSLWAWGSNLGGQLGDGTASGYDFGYGVVYDYDYGADEDDYVFIDNDKWSPVKILDSVASVCVFGYYYPGSAIAIKTDGSMWAWGSNEHGQLGDGTTERRYLPVEVFLRGTATEPETEPETEPDTKPDEPPLTTEPPTEPPSTTIPPEEPNEPTREPGRPIRPGSDLPDRGFSVPGWALLAGALLVLIIGGGVLAIVLVLRSGKK